MADEQTTMLSARIAELVHERRSFGYRPNPYHPPTYNDVPVETVSRIAHSVFAVALRV